MDPIIKINADEINKIDLYKILNDKLIKNIQDVLFVDIITKF